MINETIAVPKKLFQDMILKAEDFEQTQDALEDYLLVHNKYFLNNIRKARIAHRKKSFADWSAMKKRYGV
jgi:hypothetical protein